MLGLTVILVCASQLFNNVNGSDKYSGLFTTETTTSLPPLSTAEKVTFVTTSTSRHVTEGIVSTTPLLRATSAAIPATLRYTLTEAIVNTVPSHEQHNAATATLTRLTSSADDDFTPSSICTDTVLANYTTPCKSCARSSLATCRPGDSKLTSGRGVPGCGYIRRRRRRAGCRHVCQREEITQSCCPGFWGPDCQECPGGANAPCSDQGTCSDGAQGDGGCTCRANFSGFACERCHSPLLYGRNCSQECRCVHGLCSNGREGDGSCQCLSGYKGQHCDQDVDGCSTITCPANSACIYTDEGPECACAPGYTDLLGNTGCQLLDRCLSSPSPCDENASCKTIASNQVSCDCKEGYHGDGFVCEPIDPCQNATSGQCPSTTSCVYIGPGNSTCECWAGFENYTVGAGCVMVDLCSTSPTPCDENANCSMVAPLQYMCSCNDGYIGNGSVCYGNLLQRARQMNAEHPELQGQFNLAVNLIKFAYEDAFINGGPFTVFLPVDNGFQRGLSLVMLGRMATDREFARLLLRHHMVAAVLSSADLLNSSTIYTLEGHPAQLEYKRGALRYRLHGRPDRARVLEADQIASNGVLHVVDKLLDRTPVVQGNVTISVLDMFESDGRFNRIENLSKRTELETQLQSNGSWTVFAPINSAWDALPPGTVEYLHTPDGRGRLMALLTNHIISDHVMTADTLMNQQRIVMMSTSGIAVNLTAEGRLVVGGNSNVIQADISTCNGVIHLVDHVLIPSSLDSLLPHRCDVTSFSQVKGQCGPCHAPTHCPRTDDILLEQTESCSYQALFSEAPLDGCAQLCNRSRTTDACCDGFYGRECKPCPGGFINPCFDRGRCNDGMNNNGSCICHPQYAGTVCEMCSEPNMYGPHCNLTCTCLHGECDNRISSRYGYCRSCFPGFLGAKCDIQERRCGGLLRCHANAVCIGEDVINFMYGITSRRLTSRRVLARIYGGPGHYARLMCQCKNGYQGSGARCEPINPCNLPERGNCHIQAACTMTGPGQSRCECGSGWVGDGTYCYPSSGCANHTDCHTDAHCIQSTPGHHICVCNQDFHGNGTYCVLDDLCDVNNGGCHHNATCVRAGPGVVNCTCSSLLGGDGFSCYGSLLHEVQLAADLSLFAQQLQREPKTRDELANLSVSHTILAPSDRAMASLLHGSGQSASFWNQDANLRALIKHHILVGSLDLEALVLRYLGSDVTDGLNITSPDQVIHINGIPIERYNQPALNGLIHVLDGVLEPVALPDVPPSFTDLLRMKEHTQIMFTYFNDSGMTAAVENLESYTAFVPVDSVLMPLDLTLSRRWLPFYIVPNRMLSTYQLRDLAGTSLPTMMGTTLQQRLPISLLDDDTLRIRGSRLANTGVNLLTRTGIVHYISGVLIPVLNRCDALTGEVQCCPGYYSPSCAECPGDGDEICSGHGSCSDGVDGSGMCSCDDDFAGASCDECVGLSCMDPCEINNGQCGPFANCSSTDRVVTCSCHRGYERNGTDCISLCDSQNRTCHDLVNCSISQVGDVVCGACPGGYVGDGFVCGLIINGCQNNNGGCSMDASCSFEPPQFISEPGVVTCECNAPHVGNGTLCNSNTWDTVAKLPDTRPFFSVMSKVLQSSVRGNEMMNALQSANSSDLTLIIPLHNTSIMSQLNIDDLELYIIKGVVHLNQQTRNGSIVDTYSGTQLQIDKFGASNDTVVFTIDGVDVLEANIPTINGLIHMISEPLPTRAFTGTRSQWIIPVIITFAVVLVIMAMAIITHKSITHSTLKAQIKRMQSIGFTRFNSKETSSVSDLVTFATEPTMDSDINLSSSLLYPNPVFSAHDKD